ncbi:hypothetical protein, variant [Saprolegnia diclina VS20]|uniref:Uncharacterized protein n=1 Tax=Saprolegnia diclina (strain VS20) TaxID=1156394 RepID=T0QW18_SAPDV|nr:hypothetical protein, variant [Saprolegnia diclina VS20]EQC42414.1 hypothetical protein, variant [Saprolegnia diclina VS20]|eukprot:XP_008603837.1 hypothetical protein, variant [Saprolegnia diclina VS20]
MRLPRGDRAQQGRHCPRRPPEEARQPCTGARDDMQGLWYRGEAWAMHSPRPLPHQPSALHQRQRARSPALYDEGWLRVPTCVQCRLRRASSRAMAGLVAGSASSMHLYSARWERYLDVATSRFRESILDVVAGYGKTRWQLVPFAKHESPTSSIPALRGGDILRFCHVESEHVLQLTSDALALNSTTSSNALWAVEPLHAKWGGQAIASDVIQLRHIASGKLLGITANAPLCISASSTDNGPATFFKLASKHAGSTSFHIQHDESGVWLCGVAGSDDATIPLHCCRTVRDSDVFRVHLPSATEVYVLLDVLFTKNQFARHCAQLERVPHLKGLTFQDVQPLEICLRAVHSVLRQHPSLKFILWDQSVLASLLDNFAVILHAHQGAYQRHAELRTCVRALCFLIEDYVTDDPTSQRTIHPYLPMLQDLLGANEAVAKALTACVRDNESFLHCISRRQIQETLDRMAQPAAFEWAHEYWVYLETLCTCNGVVLGKNQALILEELLVRNILPTLVVQGSEVLVLVPQMTATWEVVASALGEPTQLYVANAFCLLARLHRDDARPSSPLMQFVVDHGLRLLENETIPDCIRAGLCAYMTAHDVHGHASTLFYKQDFSAVSYARSWLVPSKPMCTRTLDPSSSWTWEECMDQITPYATFAETYLTRTIAANPEVLARGTRQLLLAVIALAETCVCLGYYQTPKLLTALVRVLVTYLGSATGDAVDIKVRICHVLSKLATGRLNNQVSALVDVVRQHSAAVSAMTHLALEDAFHTVLVQDDCYANVHYVDVLCSLCRHGCHELTMLALGLLYSYFNTLPEIRRIAESLLILTSDAWERIYDELRDIAHAMDGENPEVPLHRALAVVTAQPLEKYQQMQRLLFHVGLHTIVIGLLQRQATRASTEWIRQCYQILVHMIGCDRSFESLLVAHVDLFLRDLPFFPSEVSHFVRSVLGHNEALVQSIPAAQVTRVADLLVAPTFLEAPSARSRLLEVLLHLVVTKQGEYIETNQTLVFNALSSHPTTLDLFTEEAGYQARLDLMARVDKPLEMVLLTSTHCIESMLKAHPDLHRLHYHATLLHLLSACSQGKNHRVEVECRSLLSLNEIVRALVDGRTVFSVRKALLAFLDAAYFDVQIPIAGLAENPAVWSLLQYVVHDLTVVLHMADAKYFEGKELPANVEVTLATLTSEARIFSAILAFLDDGVLPMLTNFFSQVAMTLTTAHAKHSQVTMHIVAVLVKILDIPRLPERTKAATIAVVSSIKENSILAEHSPSVTLTSAASSFSRLVSHKLRTISVLRVWKSEIKRQSLWHKVKREAPRIRAISTATSMRPRKDSGSFRLRYRVDAAANCTVDTPIEAFVPAQLRGFLSGFESTALYRSTLLQAETSFVQALLSPSMDDVVSHVIAYMCQHDKESATNAHEQPHVHLNLLGWLLDGRDEDLCEQQDRLARLGGGAMVLQLLSKAIHDVHGYPTLVQETLHVGLAMLRDGNPRVQADMFGHVQALGESFVSRLVHFLRLPHDDELLPIVMDLLEFLRLLCENHFAPMQHYVRNQRNAVRTYDLVDEVISYLCGFLWVVDPRTHSLVWNITSAMHLGVVVQALNTLAEFVQGCDANQRSVGASTELLHAINDVLRHHHATHPSLSSDAELPLVYDNCSVTQVQELKHSAIVLVYSILEGNRDARMPARMLATLDVATWSAYCNDVKREYDVYARLVERALETTSVAKAAVTIDASEHERHLLTSLEADEVSVETLQAKVRSHWTICCDVYVLFQTLLTPSDDAVATMQTQLEAGAPSFFNWTKLAASVGSIEIVRETDLETIYFRIPDICLSHWEHRVIRDSRERMVYMFTKDSQMSKLDSFHRYSVLLLEELQYCAHLDASPSPLLRLVLHAEDPVMHLTFWLALGLNGLHLFNHSFGTGDMATVDARVYVLAVVMAVSHFGLSLVRLVVSMVSRRQYILSNYKWQRLRAETAGAPRVLQNEAVTTPLLTTHALLSLPSDLVKLVLDRQTVPSGTCKTFTATSRSPVPSTDVPIEARVSSLALVVYNTKYNLLYSILGCLGCVLLVPALSVRGLRIVCYALMLLDVCFHRTLSNALLAVEQNRNSLVQTFYLICVVVYIYTAVGYMLFHDQYGVLDEVNTGCRTLMECVITHFNQGLRQDIASVMHIVSWQSNPTISVLRLGFDVSYWLIICVLLLNIIGGIIIDAFGELRDHRASIEKDMESNCFICGIDSLQFQRHGDGFDAHVRHDHNMWQYMFYRQHLYEKRPQEYTGQESYVADLLMAGETSFYPVGKAKRLAAT